MRPSRKGRRGRSRKKDGNGDELESKGPTIRCGMLNSREAVEGIPGERREEETKEREKERERVKDVLN